MSMASIAKIVDYWSTRFGMELTGTRCWVCGQMFKSLHRAHLKARRSKGSGMPDNLVIACKFCNDFIEICVNDSGAECTVEWVHRCLSLGWAIPPIAKTSELWRCVPDGMSMLDAAEIMESAFKLHARIRHEKWARAQGHAIARAVARKALEAAP